MVNQTEQDKLEAEGLLTDAAPPGLITGVNNAVGLPNVNLGEGYQIKDGVEVGGEDSALGSQSGQVVDGAPPKTYPEIHSATLTTQPNGTSILNVRVFDPQTGWVNRQAAIQGKFNTYTLAHKLLNIQSW